MKNHNKCALMEHAKKQYAIKNGFKSWNEYRQTKRPQDIVAIIHEIATTIIEQLQKEIKLLTNR